MKQIKKLLFFVTEDWYFCSHRLPLALAARDAGYDVAVVTRVQAHGDCIRNAGLNLIPIELSRSSMNPFSELLLILRLALIYKAEQPDIVHHVALKPVLYGSIASRLAGVGYVVSAMAGLGFIFSSKSLKARIVRPFFLMFFKLLLNNTGSRVILQNSDDAELLSNSGVLSKKRIVLIRGSGVDTLEYVAKKEPVTEPVVILASRMLWDKGVGEFVEAARTLKEKKVYARFILIGEGDIENPGSISDEQLHTWHDKGVIEWWGKKDDMPKVFAQSHIVCLPSFYGEGVPKVLIEAAACEKPIVTTDTPGCREIVHDGVNGFLVPIRDASTLAAALVKLIESPELRKSMGKKGRQLVEKNFTLNKVNRETLAIYEDLLK